MKLDLKVRNELKTLCRLEVSEEKELGNLSFGLFLLLIDRVIPNLVSIIASNCILIKENLAFGQKYNDYFLRRTKNNK